MGGRHGAPPTPVPPLAAKVHPTAVVGRGKKNQRTGRLWLAVVVRGAKAWMRLRLVFAPPPPPPRRGAALGRNRRHRQAGAPLWGGGGKRMAQTGDRPRTEGPSKRGPTDPRAWRPGWPDAVGGGPPGAAAGVLPPKARSVGGGRGGTSLADPLGGADAGSGRPIRRRHDGTRGPGGLSPSASPSCGPHTPPRPPLFFRIVGHASGVDARAPRRLCGRLRRCVTAGAHCGHTEF